LTSPDPRIPLNRHALPNFRATVDDLGECYLDHPRWRDGVLLSIPQMEWLVAEGPRLLDEMRARATAAFAAARKAKR
jgi:hypothetical protein